MSNSLVGAGSTDQPRLRALVVDDNLGSIGRNKVAHVWDDFVAEVESNDMLESEVRQVVGDASAAALDQLDDEHIDKLWNWTLRQTDVPDVGSALYEAIMKIGLFGGLLEERRRIESLVRWLNQYQVDATSTYLEEPDDSMCSYDLVFLDFYLGMSHGEAEIERSGRYLQKLHSGESGRKPFVVVMTNAPVDERTVRDRHRQSSRLIGGMYAFIPKSDLADELQFLNRLHRWDLLETTGISMVNRSIVQQFVAAAEEAMIRVARSLADDLYSLSFSDFANVQHLRLDAEGATLGDYLAQMCVGAFGFRLRQDRSLQECQDKLDRLRFREFSRIDETPSDRLTQLHYETVVEPRQPPYGPHPHVEPEHRELKLGDLFLKKQADPLTSPRVLAVIEAACNLAVGPSRQCSATQEILVIEGTTESLNNSSSDALELRVLPLLIAEGNRFRVKWDTKSLRSVSYRDFDGWRVSNGYLPHTAKLRDLYALELQQAALSERMRVGVPVPPPQVYHHRMTIYIQPLDGDVQKHETLGFPIFSTSRRLAGATKPERVFGFTLEATASILNAIARVGALVANERQTHNGNVGSTSPHLQSKLSTRERLARELEEKRVEFIRVTAGELFEFKNGVKVANLPMEVCVISPGSQPCSTKLLAIAIEKST